MKRVYNFSAGPGVLPEEVLRDAASEMLDYQNNGMSVMEMSHRSVMFQKILDDAQNDLRALMNIPNNYKILFLQGGASTQFSMIPMNLLKHGVADYIVTGAWAKKAAVEAKKFGKINIVASSEDKNFSYIPDVSDLDLSENADYLHMCDNNTIYGTKFKKLPNAKGRVLVTDISSSILSEEIDVSKFGLLYAGAQKNVGPAGTTIVIIREDLVRKDLPENMPLMMRYDIHVEKGSMYNTPPTYGIYLCGKVFKWLLNLGGVKAIQKINEEKASLLYDYLDQSMLFVGNVEKDSRSLMNISFKTNNPELDAKFIAQAKENNIVNIKGHRSTGGMRASMYNAMPIAGVKALVDFMEKFEKENV